ncbi:MAG: type 1 glutamine amidotransferase [Candidatus Hydrothermarchaeota archaeon]
MAEALIVKNIPREGPGLLGSILEEEGVAYETLDPSADPLPDPSLYRAVIVLGGPDSANDATPKMEAELTFARRALEAGVPYLGICLGLQVLIKAAGGRVYPNALKEVGFRSPDREYFTVELTAAGARDPLFEGLPLTMQVFQLHGETVDPPKGAVLLARGRYCENQALRIGKAYGLQYHAELTQEMLLRWAREDEDLRGIPVDELLEDYRGMMDEYVEDGRRLFKNFLRASGLLWSG